MKCGAGWCEELSLESNIIVLSICSFVDGKSTAICIGTEFRERLSLQKNGKNSGNVLRRLFSVLEGGRLAPVRGTF